MDEQQATRYALLCVLYLADNGDGERPQQGADVGKSAGEGPAADAGGAPNGEVGKGLRGIGGKGGKDT